MSSVIFPIARTREYVITTPRTPLPWINYLGSEAFLQPCFQHGGRVQLFTEMPSCGVSPATATITYLRTLTAGITILRDGDTVWNPAGSLPRPSWTAMVPPRPGLRSSLPAKTNSCDGTAGLFSLPRGDACEIDRLVLTNE